METLTNVVTDVVAQSTAVANQDASSFSNLGGLIEVDSNRNKSLDEKQLINIKTRLFLKYMQIDALILNGCDHA